MVSMTAHRACLLLLVLLALVECRGATGAVGQERILYRTRSDFGRIVVLEEGQVRCLAFGTKLEDRETCIDFSDPDRALFEYTGMMFVGFLYHPDTTRALHVGLGGGFMPGVFQRHLPHVRLDVVEIDSVVVKIARDYFDFKPSGDLTVTVADGRDFIEKSSDRYDQIWLDAFGEDYVPPHLTTREFLEAVRSRLTPSGVVVVNLHHSHPLFKSQVVTFRAVFNQVAVYYGKTSDNSVVVAGNDFPLAPEQVVKNAARFNGRIGEIDLRKEAGKLVPRVRTMGARVLTDDTLESR